MSHRGSQLYKVHSANVINKYSPNKHIICTCTQVTALGVLCCFALFVCLTLLASFFLPSHLSLKTCTCITYSTYVTYCLAVYVRMSKTLHVHVAAGNTDVCLVCMSMPTCNGSHVVVWYTVYSVVYSPVYKDICNPIRKSVYNLQSI